MINFVQKIWQYARSSNKNCFQAEIQIGAYFKNVFILNHYWAGLLLQKLILYKKEWKVFSVGDIFSLLLKPTVKFQKYFISWIHINDVNYSNKHISHILGWILGVLDEILDPSCADIFSKKVAINFSFQMMSLLNFKVQASLES